MIIRKLAVGGVEIDPLWFQRYCSSGSLFASLHYEADHDEWDPNGEFKDTAD
jgi:hypothetical protein